MFDRWLDLDCAYAQSGRASLRATGPSRMPEARDGLRTGKVPRRAGLVLETAGRMFSVTLNAETLALSGVKFPEVENADTPRVVFEERVAMLRELGQALDGLVAAFLQVRASSGWEGQTGQLRRWIMNTAKISQVALHFGVDDLEGTVVRERIYHEAGAHTPQSMTFSDIIRLIKDAGKRPVERDALYQELREW